MVGEKAAHLLLGFKIELLGGKIQTALLLDGAAGLDAHKHPVHLLVGSADVMAVVGNHQGDAGLPGQLFQAGVHIVFVFEAVILKLQKEIVRAKNLPVAQGRLFGGGVLAPQQGPGNLAGDAGGKGDEALVVLAQQLKVHPGAVVKALNPGFGD